MRLLALWAVAVATVLSAAGTASGTLLVGDKAKT
jgi:hypothetical protein